MLIYSDYKKPLSNVAEHIAVRNVYVQVASLVSVTSTLNSTVGKGSKQPIGK
jgi:hypothetical protein